MASKTARLDECPRVLVVFVVVPFLELSVYSTASPVVSSSGQETLMADDSNV
jgi:hypothetical protein